MLIINLSIWDKENTSDNPYSSFHVAAVNLCSSYLLLSYFFAHLIKRQVLNSSMFNLSFFNLISVTGQEQISVIHLFYCFPYSWISCPWLYLDKNLFILFFILFSSENFLKTVGLFKYVWPFCYHQA